MCRAKNVHIRSKRKKSSDGIPNLLKDESHTLRKRSSYFFAMVDVFSEKYVMRLKKELIRQHIVEL